MVVFRLLYSIIEWIQVDALQASVSSSKPQGDAMYCDCLPRILRDVIIS